MLTFFTEIKGFFVIHMETEFLSEFTIGECASGNIIGFRRKGDDFHRLVIVSGK